MLLIEAKYFPPYSPENFLVRNRLASRFAAPRSCNLISLEAPAGYGKSSTVAQWLSTVNTPSTWLSLDENDDDLVGFWHYFLNAFVRLDVGVSKGLLLLLADDAGQNIDHLITEFLNDLARIARIAREHEHKSNQSSDARIGIVVIDDFHKVRNAEIHKTIATFVNYLPVQFMIVFTSRAALPFETQKLFLQNRMRTLSYEDLLFTEDEAADYVANSIDIQLDDADKKKVIERTNGWPAALQMLVISGKHESGHNLSDLLRGLETGRSNVSTLLIEEVLTRHSSDLQRFLCITSLVPKFCAELSSSMLGDSSGISLMEEAISNGLFVIALDNTQDWYRYQDLFRGLLIERCKNQFPNERLDAIRAAAEWFSAQGYTAEAIELVFELNDLEWAVRLIESIGIEKLVTGERESLYRWIKRLPESQIYDRPKLLLLLLRALPKEIKIEQSAVILGRAKPILQKLLEDSDQTAQSTEVKTLYFETLMQMAFYLRMRGHYDEGLKWAEEANRLEGVDDSRELGRANYVLGMAYFSVGDVNNALSFLRKSIHYAISFNDPMSVVLSLLYFNKVSVIKGALLEAEQVNQLVKDWIEKNNLQNTSIGRWVFAARFHWNFEQYQLDKAEEFILRMLEECDLDDDVVTQPLMQAALYRYGFLVAIANENIEKAESYMQRSIYLEKAYGVEWTNGLQTLGVLPVQLAFLKNDSATLRSWAEENEERLLKETHFCHEADQLTLVRVYIELKEFDKALDLLETIGNRAKIAERKSRQLKVLIYQAIIREQQGLHDEATVLFNSALMLGSKYGYIQEFLSEKRFIGSLLDGLNHEASAMVHRQALLRALDEGSTENKAINVKSVALVEPLTDRELEILSEINLGGKNRDVAEKLFLSVGTVKWHLINIYQKLDVNSRTEALSRARYLGLIE